MNQPEDSPQPQTLFRAQPRYLVLALLALGVALLLLLEMRDGVSWESLLFAAIGLLGGLWALWMATTRILLTPTALHLVRPVGSKVIDFPQLISVTTQGRFLSVLTVLYHPRRADGIIDTDRVASLLAPGISDPRLLLDQLEGHLS